MGIVYRCPGRDEYGHGQNAQTVHLAGCCAQFALMTDERRAEVGLRLPDYAARRGAEPRPAPPAGQVLTVPQLAQAIEAMQRRATEFPDEEPPGASLWAQYGPEHTLEDVQALAQLGRPYNLVLGYRRAPADPEE